MTPSPLQPQPPPQQLVSRPARPRRTRKLKPLVISMGGKRQEDIVKMFSHPSMAAHFDPPAFSPGIPQRELRNQRNLLMHAGRAGILPPVEWEALRRSSYSGSTGGSGRGSETTDRSRNHNIFFLDDILKDVPIDSTNRMGSEFDKSMHYSKELWQKAKGINRGRSVLACTLAHLMAMKKLVEEGYDFILEDNVRAILCNHQGNKKSVLDDESDDDDDGYSCECADRIWNAIEASRDWENITGQECHLRYYGWLGSRTNLEFVMNVHIPKTKHEWSKSRCIGEEDDADDDESHCNDYSIFPFPIQADIDEYLLDNQHQQQQPQQPQQQQQPQHNNNNKNHSHPKPGGTPIWGAYSYWISKQGYRALIDSLQKDVGALLWKGKRMRCYHVKPIDKILPRRIMDALDDGKSSISTSTSTSIGGGGSASIGGRMHVHVATHAAFFRAPMLTSQIHSQWDAEFCKSSEYQMMKMSCNSTRSGSSNENNSSSSSSSIDYVCWDGLWLNREEKCVVEYRKTYNEWQRYNKELME